MDIQLGSLFDRVEKALGSLTDSIAKYNPSATQVKELGAADAELTKGLQELQTHQTNYARIQALRAEATKNDTQIKDTLRLLANTRKELVNASATTFPDGPNYDINYDELLSYARRISKTTIPPVGAVNAISALTTGAKGENSVPETAATTPAGGTPIPNGTQSGALPSTPAVTNGLEVLPPQTTSGPELPEPLAMWLNPHSAYTFVPWPSEEQVRQGSIANLTYIAEQGIEAEGYDPEDERRRKELEDEARRANEEKERQEREERERRFREERMRIERERERQREEQERARRASGVEVQQSPVQNKTQFQFMGDDDDDDDD
ncbi:hypothetical protein GGR57DRAFT_397443 [Xylariaceae sp. FL1272]|nr:hypothetical protein GGR57DRAFT_397443 [Xylariaceae sp. FL1272]